MKAETVHCRTGSLEVTEICLALMPGVHCRTGSLEDPVRRDALVNMGSLPHRQDVWGRTKISD